MVFSRVCNLQEILSLLTRDHDNTTYLQKNLREQSLLSFIAPSHMVAPERILVNISFPFHLSTLHNTQEPLNNMEMDMEIDTPRGQSTNSSSNSSRASSAHLFRLLLMLNVFKL